MKPFIGIKKIYYGDPFTANVTPTTLKSWISSATEVTNSHDGTWSYTQDDPEVTDYINELTGSPYYRDKTSQGTKTIAFTIGAYAFEDKVALQGGEVIKNDDETIGWKAPSELTIPYKGIVGITKTGNIVVFTNASIVGKVDTQEKNLGLGVTAVAMDSGVTGVADEYWFAAEAISD